MTDVFDLEESLMRASGRVSSARRMVDDAEDALLRADPGDKRRLFYQMLAAEEELDAAIRRRSRLEEGY